MNAQQLSSLQKVYAKNHSSSLKKEIELMYQYYLHNKEKALLDITASVAALSAMAYHSEEFELTPQMEEAFQLQYPNLDLAEILSEGNIEGYINGWKGKYFEVLVRDELNEGGRVGDIQLSDGQVAYLAESPTQPGWDLQILNADGSAAEELQLKATDSLSYVKDALETYPEIDIITTEEVFQNGGSSLEAIHNSGISNAQLEQELMTASSAGSGANSLLEGADMLIPGLPFALIVATEGTSVFMGRKTWEMAKTDFIRRSIKTGASMSAGSAVFLLDGGLLSIPAALATRLGIDRYEIYKQLDAKIRKRTLEMRRLPIPN